MSKDISKEKDNNIDKIRNLREQIRTLELRNRDIDIELELQNKKVKTNFQLNTQQQLAVDAITGNSIIVACPGSGKTHTLIAKVANLVLNHNVDPNSIILITFTKKAAQEIENRLQKYLKEKKLLHAGTIHGLAYRTLQKHDKINYTVLDESESYRVMRKIADETSERKRYKLTDEDRSAIHKQIVAVYELLSAKYPMELKALLEWMKLNQFYDCIKRVLQKYSKYKKEKHYLDFNDIMSRFLAFLQESRASEFKNSIKYVLFDEYQDVNSIQDKILKEIECANTTVVGDDAQAIYAFRGSQVKFIIGFHENYHKVKTFKLEKNYRSPPEIVTLCNSIIANNSNQLKKDMKANKNAVKTLPKIVGFPTAEDEVNYVVNCINTRTKSGIKLKEQAILARKNRQLDNFELELIKHQISYMKSKGVGILDRVHVKDFLAFLIVLVNPKSEVHWRRVLKLTAGIGVQTADLIIEQDPIILDTVVSPGIRVGRKVANLMTGITKLFKEVHKLYLGKKFEKICSVVIKYLKPIVSKNMRMGEKTTYDEKIEDMYTLMSYLNRSGTIEQFLMDIHFSVEVNETKKFSDDDDYLLLTTIHGAKGLEWEYVHLIGCSSDIIPSYRPALYLEEMHEVEEERRLFYVGCSRAKEHLEISLSYDYHFVSNDVYCSPFIRELDSKLYDDFNLVFPERFTEGNVTSIVKSYLLTQSTTKIHSWLQGLPYEYKSYYTPVIDSNIYRNKVEKLYGAFIDNMIAKMLQTNYPDRVDDLTVPIYKKYNLREDKHYHNYTDTNNRWKDCIKSILYVSKKKSWCPVKVTLLLEWLQTEEQMGLYDKIEKYIKSVIPNTKDKIYPHQNLSFSKVLGEADIVVGDTLIEIKTSKECIATTQNVLQTIMYRYLLHKKGIRIQKIVMFNPLLGESYTLLVSPTWKHTFRVYKEITDTKDAATKSRVRVKTA